MQPASCWLNWTLSLSFSPPLPPSVTLAQRAYASTPSNSGGRGDFGCLLSKCCLKVFGSGIWDCRRRQRKGKNTTDRTCLKNFSRNRFLNTSLTGEKKEWLPIAILTLHTRQVNTSAAFAAVFWSWPLAFFISACFLAFFCWLWIFWCPRAILAEPKGETGRENDLVWLDSHQRLCRWTSNENRLW